MKKAAQPDYKALYEQSLLTLEQEREKAKDILLKEKKKSEEVLAEAKELLTEKDQKITLLTFELEKFRKFIHGSKSEKLPLKSTDLSQMSLFDLGTPQQEQEDLSEQAEEQAQKRKTPKKRAKGTGRMSMPNGLRREVIIIEPEEDTTGYTLIGEDVTEVLEIVPAELYVIEYRRRKYARPEDKGIAQGQLPDRVINKGIPSDKLIAQMTLDKYVYGLPLHRQIDKYRRLGVNIPASTASDWLMKGWKHLVPLWELMKLLVINQKYLQVDESPIKVQDKRHKNNIHKGYMWVYNCPVDSLVLFDYQKGRDMSGPKEMLKDFTGIIQTDGYSVYETLYGNHSDIILVYCMAHARRKFVEAEKYDKEKANYFLRQVGLLYKLEAEMREEGLDWKQRTQRRQKEAKPILKTLGNWLKEQATTVLPNSPLGKAIFYALPRWEGLSAYTEHGQLEIDNNLVENAIRPLAIGRKNYLFAGSHDAAEMTAAMYSFMATCKKNGVNEMEWLTDVLQRIQGHKRKDLYQLLPNNWSKHEPTV